MESFRGLTGLIIGSSGFVGKHLTHHLLSAGWEIHGFDRVRLPNSPIDTIQGDLLDRKLLVRQFVEKRPQVVFHLAGVLKSDQPELLYRVHILGTESVFDAIVEAGIKPLVIVASSSAIYGAGNGSRPVTETFKPRPVTHYAISKLAQEMVAFRYNQMHGIQVICLRAFNLVGPGQPPDLACSAFARQIALGEVRGDSAISTGNLGAYRDFVDVRDVARSYALVAMYGRPGRVYNVCSGRAVSIRKCLDMLLKLTNRSFQVVSDPKQRQITDVSIQVGSAKLIQRHCGWRPRISLQKSLTDLLIDWRRVVKSQLNEHESMESR